MQTFDDIRAWLVIHIAEIVGIDPAEVDPRATFESFGLASRDAVSLSGDLEDWLERRLSPTLLYQYTTIDALAHHLAQDGHEPASGAGRSADASARPTPSQVTETRADELAALSDDEAEALLLEKLTQLD